jgi:hypothetical protein
MAKIKDVKYEHNGKVHHEQYLYWCEGCGYEHAFALHENGGHHSFNGDLDNPTVSPSLVQNFTPGKMCHSFIRDGKIQYLGDCWHHLKGQTIELPDVEQKIEERKRKAKETKEINGNRPNELT